MDASKTYFPLIILNKLSLDPLVINMSFDNVQTSGTHGRSLLPPERRSLLWNMVEPGDNYDIRKSMIAKLPGSRNLYMGDHI